MDSVPGQGATLSSCEVLEMPAAHSPLLSRPDDFAALLVDLSARRR
ncbi:MAG TPA: hypothetical protein VN636_06870 [Acidimicrobiia bacterium]|nr:hypothetical protein [Acidimicrobiia bacterium]